MRSCTIFVIAIGIHSHLGETGAINEVGVSGEPDWEDEDFIFKDMTLIGVAGIEDPVRPEVSLLPCACFYILVACKAKL